MSAVLLAEGRAGSDEEIREFMSGNICRCGAYPQHRRRHPRGLGAVMQAFQYMRADDAASAVALVSGDPKAQYLAGGTTQVDLMLNDGVLEPER
jgi:hypothetical protein